MNTTYSAVRLTHLPTSIQASCQDGKSQSQNTEQAFKVLFARVNEHFLKEQQTKIDQDRKNMISTGDRSAKIRTYNYARSSVTDHRIHYTHQNLPAMLDGHLDGMIESLRLADHDAKLATTD